MILPLAFALASASAAPVTLANLCDGIRLVQKSDRLELFCPGATVPFFTFAGCLNASAKKDSRGNYTITCGTIKPFKVVPQ